MRDQFVSLFRPIRPVRDAVTVSQYGTGRIETTLTDTQTILQRATRDHPNDYSVQLAAAIEYPTARDTRRLDLLRRVAMRFPNRPSIYAHLLRYYTLDLVGFHRPEEDELTGSGPPTTAEQARIPHPTPADLAAFDRDAATGERLDSNNAYFPLVRAIGLFAAHRDDAAIAAIQRAASKNRWNDYLAEEAQCRWALWQEYFGYRDATDRIGVMATQLFPHFARLRAVTRMAVYIAMQDERNGEIAQGVAIRHAVIRCASLIRSQSANVVGSLVGVALERIAAGRPGGAPTPRRTPGISADQYARAWLAEYDTFLRKHGYANESAWFTSELRTAFGALDILRLDTEIGPVAGQPMDRLLQTLFPDGVLLANTLWLLAAGLALSVYACSRRGIGNLFAVALGLTLLFIGMAVRLHPWARDARIVSGYSASTGDLSNAVYPPIAIFSLATVCLPLAVVCVPTLYALVSKRPAARVLGFATVGAGLFGAVMYAALVLWTARQDFNLQAALDRYETGAGPYLARREGRTWPGPAPL